MYFVINQTTDILLFLQKIVCNKRFNKKSAVILQVITFKSSIYETLVLYFVINRSTVIYFYSLFLQKNETRDSTNNLQLFYNL